MPRYNIEPRLSGRDKRLAQLGQIQESGQRQQQADAAQQNAMLGQVAQLYGLQNAQEEQSRLGELHPMHLQQLQDAHNAAQWNLGQQQQMGPEQLRGAQLVNAGQQGQNVHQDLINTALPEDLRQRQEGQGFANDITRANAGNIDTLTEQGNRGREADIANAGQTYVHGGLVNEGLGLANKGAGLTLDAMPENIRLAHETARQGLDLGKIQLGTGQTHLDWLPSQLGLQDEALRDEIAGHNAQTNLTNKHIGAFDTNNDAALAQIRAKIVMDLNPTTAQAPWNVQRAIHGTSPIGTVMDTEKHDSITHQIQGFLATFPPGQPLDPTIRAQAERLFPGQVDVLWPNTPLSSDSNDSFAPYPFVDLLSGTKRANDIKLKKAFNANKTFFGNAQKKNVEKLKSLNY